MHLPSLKVTLCALRQCKTKVRGWDVIWVEIYWETQIIISNMEQGQNGWACWNNGQGALVMPENDTNGFKNSCKYKLKIVVGYPPMRSSGKALEQNIISSISCQLQRASLFACKNLSKTEQSWGLNVETQAWLPVSHSSGCVGASRLRALVGSISSQRDGRSCVGWTTPFSFPFLFFPFQPALSRSSGTFAVLLHLFKTQWLLSFPT